MGARVSVEPDPDSGCEPVGTVRVEGTRLQGVAIGGAEIPRLIDEIPLLAVAGVLARGRTVIREAAELRLKETDRLTAMAVNLTRLGADVEEHPDGLAIEGAGRPAGGETVESYGDHRIAMAMAVLSLFTEQPVAIRAPGCIATSYPGFWDDFERIGGNIAADNGS
jgi:3-phosphoshikimate 1-carboxyvinyltransferase